MPKAQITTPSGIKVNVEGTASEIRDVVEELEARERKKKSKVRETASSAHTKPRRKTLAGLLESLVEEGFFKQPRDLGSIKSELDAKGLIKPVTTLSGAVLSQIRRGNLRRVKKDGHWFYARSA